MVKPILRWAHWRLPVELRSTGQPRAAVPTKPQESISPARVQSAIKNQQSKILPASVTPASQLDIRPAPEMVSSGIPALDTLTGGLPRGCLTEICGPASSGRTTLLLAALAAATHRGEFCAVVDASDALDPHSAAAAGVELDRCCGCVAARNISKDQSSDGCPISRASFAREVRDFSADLHSNFDRAKLHPSEHRLEQVLRATDLLLESGGFGLIVLDLGDLPPQAARHIPLTTWFRFRRAVENTPTILLAIEQHPIAGSCSSLLLQLGSADEIASTEINCEPREAGESMPRCSPRRQPWVSRRRMMKPRRGERKLIYPLNPNLISQYPRARATAHRTEYHRGTDPLAPGPQTRALRRVRNQNRLGGMKNQ